MGVVVTQLFEAVGSEVGNQQAPARPHHASGLADGGTGVVEIVQHLVDGDEIAGGIGKGQGIDIAMADLNRAQTCPLDIEAGYSQHVTALINAD